MTSFKSQGLLSTPMPSINDKEGDRVPEFLPPVVDAHVHLFPDRICTSIWKWFDQFGWPIRYKLTSSRAIEFLLSRGIDHIVALHYAHKPGIAREMNTYMADVCRSHSRVTGLATVLPGEKNAAEILKSVNHAAWEDIHINVISEEAATFTAKFSYGFTSIDDDVTNLRGVWTALFILDQGAWKIRLRHESFEQI